MKKIILGSQSPRRRELLAGLGLPFEVRVIDGISEGYPDGLSPMEIARYIAAEKAQPYAVSLGADDLLVCADTIVVVDEAILGKPHDAADAQRMLRLLSERTIRSSPGSASLRQSGRSVLLWLRMLPSSSSLMRRSTITSPISSLSTRLGLMVFKSG